MGTRLLPLLGLVALLATLAVAAQATASERVALVIGNGSYRGATPLKNPVNDAKAVAASLERLGFAVHLATELDQKGMLEALDKFSSLLPDAKAALFYYSGHGMQLDQQNFLLPV